MKKRRTLLWVLFFVLLSLAGCAGAEPEKEMAAESAAGERKADHSGLQEKLEQRLSSYEKEHPGDVVWPLSGEPVHWPFAGTTLRNWDDSCEVYGILSKRLKITLETGTGTVTAEGREEDREWLRGELGQIPVNAEETAAFGQLSEE